MRQRVPQPGQRVQLHRALSKLGWCSRTQAKDCIRRGEIAVDGRIVTDPFTWVDLIGQRIERLGEGARASSPVAGSERSVALALHKPPGVVTSRKDELDRQTVYDLLPPDTPWVFPVGRLDADSEGLLILTNDSQLSFRLTDPKQHLPKTYRVTVRGTPAEAELEPLRQGMELRRIGSVRPARLRVLEQDQRTTTVEMILTEGRNRQIRRMWAALGYRVRRLVRVAIGGLELGDLPTGQCRLLRADEIDRLVVHLSSSDG